MSVSISVDNREGQILFLLEDDDFKKLIVTANLDIGDIIYSIDKIPYVIIERKTVSDLSASIKDGRYKEQKYRLLKEQKKGCRIIYLIEGDIWAKPKYKPETLYSVIINSMIRDGIFVYISKNIGDTISFMKKINVQMNKIKNDLIKPNYMSVGILNDTSHSDTSRSDTSRSDTSRSDTSHSDTSRSDTSCSDADEYAQLIKISKKSNFTPRVCYICQLAQIPRISQTIAISIVNKYPTMNDLILAYNKLEKDSDKEQLLSELKYNNRRIGKITSRNIYYFLFNINDKN